MKPFLLAADLGGRIRSARTAERELAEPLPLQVVPVRGAQRPPLPLFWRQNGYEEPKAKVAGLHRVGSSRPDGTEERQPSPMLPSTIPGPYRTEALQMVHQIRRAWEGNQLLLIPIVVQAKISWHHLLLARGDLPQVFLIEGCQGQQRCCKGCQQNRFQCTVRIRKISLILRRR